MKFSILKKITPLFLALGYIHAQLHTGDLVFRQGQGFFSEIARNFSPTDKRFSHVGIIYIDKNKTYVIHSVDDNDKNLHGVSKVHLKSFISEALQYSFYTLHLNYLHQKEMKIILEEQVRRHLPFDTLYSLKSDSSVYCTEFIWKVLRELLNKDIITGRTSLNNEIFLSIEDVLKIPGLIKISQ